MGTIVTALTTWDEFLLMPDPEPGNHYELHDGEVVLGPPPKAIHIYIQALLTEWLNQVAGGQGRAMPEFPYRPAANLQFWYAGVAYLPIGDWQAMRSDSHPVYAPPLIVEVLSPSNGPEQIRRRRVVAFSAGTREFWVVDPDAQTIEVSIPGATSRLYAAGEEIPVQVLPGALFPVRALFES